MHSRSCWPLLSCALLLSAGALLRAAGDAPPVEVVVEQPVTRRVTDYAEFTGRTEAVESVELRARVSGYLVNTPFKEGSEVKQGELLFEIDPRPYQAELDQAAAQVELHRASLRLAKAVYDRDRAAAAANAGAVNQQQLDQDRSAVLEAAARLRAAQAGLELHKLNLDFTRVRSPIHGRVGRYHVTRGNLVRQDETVLTTVVSLDPMYVYFDVDERTLLQLRNAINAGRIKSPAEASSPVFVGLAGEQGWPHQATVNYLGNRVNPNTGTVPMRAVLPNPKPSRGVRLLSPGMFVRVRLPIGQPHSALLVPEQAVGRHDGIPFVYVVNGKDVVERRQVHLGQRQEGLREVTEGLTAEDRVVVKVPPGLRAGGTVRARRGP